MPVDARPTPLPGTVALPGAVPVRREYRDALGRALTGTVTITPQARADLGGVAVLAAPFPVELVGGMLEVLLPPGAYRLSASLHTAENVAVTDTGTLTVAAASA